MESVRVTILEKLSPLGDVPLLRRLSVADQHFEEDPCADGWGLCVCYHCSGFLADASKHRRAEKQVRPGTKVRVRGNTVGSHIEETILELSDAAAADNILCVDDGLAKARVGRRIAGTVVEKVERWIELLPAPAAAAATPC